MCLRRAPTSSFVRAFPPGPGRCWPREYGRHHLSFPVEAAAGHAACSHRRVNQRAQIRRLGILDQHLEGATLHSEIKADPLPAGPIRHRLHHAAYLQPLAVRGPLLSGQLNKQIAGDFAASEVYDQSSSRQHHGQVGGSIRGRVGALGAGGGDNWRSARGSRRVTGRRVACRCSKTFSDSQGVGGKPVVFTQSSHGAVEEEGPHDPTGGGRSARFLRFNWSLTVWGHPGAALLVGPILICAPHALSRAVTTRMAGKSGTGREKRRDPRRAQPPPEWIEAHPGFRWARRQAVPR